jgi:hypothetical protein
MANPASPTTQFALSPILEEIRNQLVEWLSVIRVPDSPTATSWYDYVEPMRSQPWDFEHSEADSLKVNLFTGENRYLLLVRPEGSGFSLTVYVLSRNPFRDELPFNEDSFSKTCTAASLPYSSGS